MTEPQTRKPLFSLPVNRTDLRWIEAKLGESLQNLPKAPMYGVVQPQLDASVIPMGEHCYDPELMANGYVPCPYFTKTAYGTTQCAYVEVEAYDNCTLDDNDRLQFEKQFGCREQAEAAGVIEMLDLPDSMKICSVKLLYPSTIEYDLEPAIERYEKAVMGARVSEDIYGSAGYAAMARNDACLKTAAVDRYGVWLCLCSMIEPVPPELLHRIQLADALFRGATSISETILPCRTADDLPTYPDPKKQFWYFYRQDFDNPFLGADQVSLVGIDDPKSKAVIQEAIQLLLHGKDPLIDAKAKPDVEKHSKQ